MAEVTGLAFESAESARARFRTRTRDLHATLGEMLIAVEAACGATRWAFGGVLGNFGGAARG